MPSLTSCLFKSFINHSVPLIFNFNNHRKENFTLLQLPCRKSKEFCWLGSAYITSLLPGVNAIAEIPYFIATGCQTSVWQDVRYGEWAVFAYFCVMGVVGAREDDGNCRKMRTFVVEVEFDKGSCE